VNLSPLLDERDPVTGRRSLTCSSRQYESVEVSQNLALLLRGGGQCLINLSEKSGSIQIFPLSARKTEGSQIELTDPLLFLSCSISPLSQDGKPQSQNYANYNADNSKYKTPFAELLRSCNKSQCSSSHGQY